MALCKTDKEIAVRFASISKRGPKVSDEALLSGFGCINPGGGGGNDGILRYGVAKVTQLPAGTNNWFYTKASAALCFGDSGGPSFLKLSDPAREKHFVIGVNSRGNIRDVSMMTALFIEKSQDFFKRFADDEGVEICGINQNC